MFWIYDVSDREGCLALIFVIILGIALLFWTDSCAKPGRLNECQQLMKLARSHQDSMVVWATRTSQYAETCRVILTPP